MTVRFGKLAGLMTGVLMASASALAQDRLTPDERTRFVGRQLPSCIRGAGTDLAISLRDILCRCALERMASTLPLRDILLQEQGKTTPELDRVLTRVLETCVAEARSRGAE